MIQEELNMLVNKTKERLELLDENNPSRNSFILTSQELKFEEYVLGSMLLWEEVSFDLMELILGSPFFVEPKHQKIIEAITYIYAYSGKVDIPTVSKQLKINEDLNFIGGESFLEYLKEKKRK